MRKGLLVVGLAITLTLTACGAEASDPSGSTPSYVSRAEWRPKQPISHTQMSEAEARRLRAESLARMAAQYEIKNPPMVALVRWTTMEDYGPTMAACLKEAGFNAVAVGGAGMEYPDGIPESQKTAFELADYICSSRYSIHPRFVGKYTAEQWALFYDYMAEFLVPCLRGLGKQVSDPPTRDTFIAQAVQGHRDWDPYAEASEKTGKLEDRLRLAATCSKDPPVEYMWGHR